MDKLLLKTSYYESSDWCDRHLGNYREENFTSNKMFLGHEYKNVDSVLDHHLNKHLSELTIKVYCSPNRHKREKYLITDNITITKLNKNVILVTTNKAGVVVNHNFLVSNCDWYYTIEIYKNETRGHESRIQTDTNYIYIGG